MLYPFFLDGDRRRPGLNLPDGCIRTLKGVRRHRRAHPADGRGFLASLRPRS
jgi:hypothetical protein